MLEDVGARRIPGNQTVCRRRRAHSRRGGKRVAARVDQAANLRARDAKALVRALERQLDCREVRIHACVERTKLQVVADGLRCVRITRVYEWQHGRREGRALRCILLRTFGRNLAHLVRIPEGALHERHRHQAHDLLDYRTHISTPTATKENLSKLELLEEEHIHLRGARRRIPCAAASAKVFAALVRKTVQQLSRLRATRALERSRVERDSLVQRVHRITIVRVRVAVCAIRAHHTVVVSILQLADHIHPHVHVHGALLDCLDAGFVAKRTEVVRAMVSRRPRHQSTRQSGRDEHVGVVKVPEVAVEL